MIRKFVIREYFCAFRSFGYDNITMGESLAETRGIIIVIGTFTLTARYSSVVIKKTTTENIRKLAKITPEVERLDNKRPVEKLLTDRK